MRPQSAKLLIIIAVALSIVNAVGNASAQRRISPVRPATGINLAKERGDSLNTSKLVERVDESGRKVLIDTVAGTEVPDTIGTPLGKVPKMIQPLVFSSTLGVDIWDPVMRVFGQHYGLLEFSAEFNMHNRYIPVVEIGLGQTDYTPDRQNYTYKVGTTPYFRVGCNYNFLYNSNPAYQAYGGIRFGLSSFNYQLTGVTIDSDYWGEQQTVDFPRQHSTVVYMNLMFGIRVKIAGPISMGWALRFKTKLHESKNPGGDPWYIPGYGSRNGSITGSFSVFYTFQLQKPRPTDIKDKKD